MDIDGDTRVGLFKQKRPLIVQVGDKACPDGTWKVGESEKGESVCSGIDRKPCEDISSNVDIVWSNPITNEEGLISEDGIVRCEWPVEALEFEDFERIWLLSNGVDNLDDLPDLAFPPPPPSKNACTTEVSKCLAAQSIRCPKDIFGTGDEMTICSVLIAGNNGLNVTNGSTCEICSTTNVEIYDNAKIQTCETQKTVTQDCLCIAPGRENADPVLSKNNLYNNMPPPLKEARGVWYSPCGVKNYLNPETLRSATTTTTDACLALDNYLRSTGVDFTDLKSRTKCYDNNGNFIRADTFLHKHWWAIALVVVFLLIIIFVIAASSSKK